MQEHGVHEFTLEKCFQVLRSKDSPPMPIDSTTKLNAAKEMLNASIEMLSAPIETLNASAEKLNTSNEAQNDPTEKLNVPREMLNVSTENMDASSAISSAAATMVGESPMVSMVDSLEQSELLQDNPLTNEKTLQNESPLADLNISPLKEATVNVKPVDQMEPEKAFAM